MVTKSIITEAMFHRGLRRAADAKGMDMIRMEPHRYYGLPDIVFKWRRHLMLAELKVARQVRPLSYWQVWKMLSPAQQKWHQRWGDDLHYSYIIVWTVNGTYVMSSGHIWSVIGMLVEPKVREPMSLMTFPTYKDVIQALCDCV